METKKIKERLSEIYEKLNYYYHINTMQRYNQHSHCRDGNRSRKGAKQLAYHEVMAQINRLKREAVELKFQLNLLK